MSEALQISSKTLQKIRQNLAWAFAYNAVAIPLAAGALLPATGLALTPSIAGAPGCAHLAQAGCSCLPGQFLSSAHAAGQQCTRPHSCCCAGAMMGFSSLAVMGNSMLLHLEAGRLGALPGSKAAQHARPGLQVQSESAPRWKQKKEAAPPAAARETLPV